jgi:SAM-dependent methyltransferase
MSKYSENIPPSLIGAIGWFYDEIPENATVLDVGCSTGYYGAYVKEYKHCKVFGIEVSNDKIEAAKVLDGVYSFDLDGEWPKSVYERVYDVVFLGDVIEHLKDPGAALQKILPLLSPSGSVFISTPNIAHISTRLELLGGGFEYESMGILDNTHLKYFTLNSLTNIVHNAGYEIIRIDSSESDYPREVIESILTKYGLKASKPFWEMVKDPTARAFQYKFVLKASKGSGKHISAPSPAQKPEQYKATFIQEIQNQSATLKKDFNDARELIQDQTKLIHELKLEVEKRGGIIEEITGSKAYKLSQKIQHAKQATRKIVKNNL